MAPRANWKGYLRLSLVSCPIALYPASSLSEKVSFNRINRKTGNRLKQQNVDSESGQVVSRDDMVRGYEIAKGPRGESPGSSRSQSVIPGRIAARWKAPTIHSIIAPMRRAAETRCRSRACTHKSASRVRFRANRTLSRTSPNDRV
jgi:Ku70/Ku80 beta-barrel domain